MFKFMPNSDFEINVVPTYINVVNRLHIHVYTRN